MRTAPGRALAASLVFPTPGPGGADDPEWWLYGAAEPQPWEAPTTILYLGRRLLTGAGLIAMALLLVWAVGELGDGLGAVFDLMRGDPGATVPTTGLLTG